MSATFSYVPIPPPVVANSFHVGLADIITRYLIHDGPPPAPRTQLEGIHLTKEAIPFLKGVALASPQGGEIRNDAEAMIETLDKYGAIELEVNR